MFNCLTYLVMNDTTNNSITQYLGFLVGEGPVLNMRPGGGHKNGHEPPDVVVVHGVHVYTDAFCLKHTNFGDSRVFHLYEKLV